MTRRAEGVRRSEEVTTAMTGTDIGGRVRDAREKRGLSLADTARMTRLSPSIVQAIERNDFASLPAGMYRKAYLRTVAAEVGLDPLAIAADYDAQYDAPSDSATALIEMTTARNQCGEALHPSRRHALAGGLFWRCCWRPGSPSNSFVCRGNQRRLCKRADRNDVPAW
jgi:transcriptional regulator with XRE-family HTH domain